MVLSCEKPEISVPVESFQFTSFREIPGVTAEEIAAIENLKKEREFFSYGSNFTTEAFLTENGEISGFSALFCEWLTTFFGIRFQPEIYAWNEMLDKFNKGTVDFTGSLTATAERMKIYHMTDFIAERIFKMMRLKGSRTLEQIAHERLPRYAFLQGSNIANIVAEATVPGTYETVRVSDIEEAHRALENGSIDAFIGGSVTVDFFFADNVYTEDFYPLIFSPVSMATAKDELQPVISVVNKALRNGAIQHLNSLYSRGDDAYRKNKFLTNLNEEEKEYLKNTVTVPLLYQYFNYPTAFYDTKSKKWDGIALDVLHEVEKLSGLTFEIVNDEHTFMPELIEMLSDGRGQMLSEMIPIREREPYFIWSKNSLMTDQYALLSKMNFPNVTINEIPYMRIALTKGTAHEKMFRTWFPNTYHITEYVDENESFTALEEGKVDMVMAAKNKLLYYANYFEFSGYKANYLFNYYYDSAFTYNKDQSVLCAIVDKAISVIDILVIREQWRTKTYDYHARLIAEQRPWLVGAAVLFLIILILVSVMLHHKRSEGKRLEKLVVEQTASLVTISEEARRASEAKSRFVANMSHEIRSPMNVIVGLTNLMLEEDDTPGKIKEILGKISTAGNTLMGLINDVLDISKVEAGKMDLMPVQYDFASLLNDIIILNIIRIEDKPVTFKLDISDDLPVSLFGDDLRVKQILNNLLSNAFKYTKEGNVTLGVKCEREINAASNADGVWVSFSVSDTGIGIHKDNIGKLFTDYNQIDTQANRKILGTGLGLSITKKFVELLNGEVSVESEYGKGSIFSVRIRQGFVDGRTMDKETVESLRTFKYSDKRKEVQKKLARSDLSYARVLVVDDFPSNLEVAAGMLRKYKMQVDCVTNGQEAIDRIAAEKPVYNAIFMDHMMPGMDGVEATKAIRALDTKYAKNIPVIALTANVVAGNKQMFLDNGFNALLPKPVNVMIMDSIVQRWIRDKSRE
ncbi:MAG: transporter substrate-binding domain-containing protein [Treponema sp.]|nr:transporter substrate-binding domain-containing protein [Treponema sp.]